MKKYSFVLLYGDLCIDNKSMGVNFVESRWYPEDRRIPSILRAGGELNVRNDWHGK